MIIKNQKEYLEILKECEKLISIDPQPESEEGKRLNKITEAITVYEKKLEERRIKKEEKQEKKEEPKKDPITEIYEKLSTPIEDEYIIEYEEDGIKFKGYNAIGAINRLNEVLGINHWKTNSMINHQEQISGGWAVAMDIEIIITDNNGAAIIKAEGSGGAYAKKIENAYKGARTSAFKNACKYLGIGKELYKEIKVDDDIIYVAEEKQDIKIEDETLDKLVITITNCSTIEQLQTLEEKVKAVDDRYKAIMFKKYNDKKIELMSK